MTNRATLLRGAKVVGGFVLLVAGIAMLALPGPGWLAIFAGLTLLAAEFHWARQLRNRLKRFAGRFYRPGAKPDAK